MASSNWMLEMKDTRRPCILYGKNGPEKCFFHRWSNISDVVPPSLLRGGHSGGTVSMIVAVLEFEDGSIRQYTPEHFKFVDGGGFSDIVWPELDEEKENDCI